MTAPTSTSSKQRLSAVRKASAKASAWLKAQQHDDGCWWLDVQMSPTVTATAQLVMAQMGFAEPGDAARFLNWVSPQQHDDGSFNDNFFSGDPKGPDGKGGLRATAAVWGALRASGVDNTNDVLRKAQAYIDANGGLEALAKMPMGEDAFAVGPLLAYAELLPPDTLALRHFPLFQTLIPFANDVMARLVNVGFIYTEQLLAGLVTSLIERGMHGPVRVAERARVEKLALSFQNENGSWNDTVNQTILSMAALHAMGMDAKAEPIKRAAAFVQSFARRTDDTLHYLPIGSAVWDTALVLEALLCAGTPADDVAVKRGVRWALSAQLNEDMPVIDQPRPGERRSGGFAFEDDNPTMPDCDDTGLVLGALGRWQETAAPLDVDEELIDDNREGIRRGLDWIRGMQHTDGGWGAYMSEQPRRPRGALFAKPILDTSGLDWGDPKAVVEFLSTTMIEAADVSTAGLTGRVLHGVCVAGPTINTPGVRAAIDFLFDQQLPFGGWLGRWVVNYLAGTGWVLKALGAARVERDDPHIVKAVEWLRSVQNDDGGFGESTTSYRDQGQAGVGPSMPGLTGLVLCGLQSAGWGDDPMVLKGIDYLVGALNGDGTWDNAGWQHVWFPPVYFYVLPSADHTYPLEALGRFLGHKEGRDLDSLEDKLLDDRLAVADDEHGFPVRTPSGAWRPEGLRQWRQRGDPEADAFIDEVFAHHERAAVNDLFRKLVHNDDPLPPDLDPTIKAWFGEHSALPAWADHGKIQRAHDFYERDGWKIALGLFCSSLPQTYACANGARVLGQTQLLTQHTRRRILETAQFIFDVLDPGAFSSTGRGIRAAQKVRLLHTTIRHFTLRDAAWDMGAWGVPINQEDMAMTLMAFSVVILDAIEQMDGNLDPDDADAYLHLWCCVGHMMGINEVFLPKSRADGEALMQAFRDDQWQASPYGHRLAMQLVDSMAAYFVLPGGRSVASSLVRSIAGDKCADLLGLPDHGFEALLAKGAIGLVGRFTTRGGRHLRATLFQRLATVVMQGLIDVQREGKQASFRLPNSLLHGWGIGRRRWF